MKDLAVHGERNSYSFVSASCLVTGMQTRSITATIRLHTSRNTITTAAATTINYQFCLQQNASRLHSFIGIMRNSHIRKVKKNRRYDE